MSPDIDIISADISIFDDLGQKIIKSSNVKRVFELEMKENFIKKETMAQVLSCEFCKSSKNNFSYRTSPAAASVNRKFNS